MRRIKSLDRQCESHIITGPQMEIKAVKKRLTITKQYDNVKRMAGLPWIRVTSEREIAGRLDGGCA